jgi:hypothetical protein
MFAATINLLTSKHADGGDRNVTISCLAGAFYCEGNCLVSPSIDIYKLTAATEMLPFVAVLVQCCTMLVCVSVAMAIFVIAVTVHFYSHHRFARVANRWQLPKYCQSFAGDTHDDQHGLSRR